MKFRNPNNDYVESITYCWLWCLVFGFFYFVLKGVWTHAVIALALAYMTHGISWLIYPFFANSIISKNYLRKGWVAVEEYDVFPAFAGMTQKKMQE